MSAQEKYYRRLDEMEAEHCEVKAAVKRAKLRKQANAKRRAKR